MSTIWCGNIKILSTIYFSLERRKHKYIIFIHDMEHLLTLHMEKHDAVVKRWNKTFLDGTDCGYIHKYVIKKNI